MNDMNAGEEATAYFQEDNRDLLASFDDANLFDAIAAWCRVEGVRRAAPTDETEDLLVLLEMGFLELLRKGIIAPVRELTPAGQAQLDRLRGIYVTAADRDGRNKAASEQREREFSVVVADFKNLSSAEFKAKIVASDDYRKLVDDAAAAGRI